MSTLDQEQSKTRIGERQPDPAPDPGALPAWGVEDLPAPQQLGLRTMMRAIGPGIIMLGGSIGTGEWLLGPAVTARFQGQMLWLATIAILLQSFLNIECIRYALYTGEPVFTGYLRTKPGPRFWSIVYLICDLGMFLPAFAANIAALLLAAWLGYGSKPEDKMAVMWIGIGISLLCFVLMLFGGKIYNGLQASMTAMVIAILTYLVIIDIFLVPMETWLLLLRGFFWPFKEGFQLAVPPGLKLGDWAMIAGFAAYAGAGGLSNATFSNYARDKGWGMGSRVGAIPSAVAGVEIELSPLGKIFLTTQQNMARWAGWWRHILFDQYGIWVAGCFLGMMLPAAMTLKFVQPTDKIDGMQVASMQARGIADAFPQHKELFWTLTLLCGFLILWSTQVQVLDHVTRRWTDILWSASGRARTASRGGVQRIYYTIAAFYAFMNCAVLVANTLLGATPLEIAILSSVTGGMALVVSSFHTAYVNHRFLPASIRPPAWRTAGLVLCGLFYLITSSLAVYGQLLKGK